MFYAVAIGRQPGVYQTWNECKAQVDSFRTARYKKFASRELAEQFIEEVTLASKKKSLSNSKSSSCGESVDSQRGDGSIIETEMSKIRKSIGSLTSLLGPDVESGVKQCLQSILKSVDRTESYICTSPIQRESTSNEPAAKKARSNVVCDVRTDSEGFTVNSDGFVQVYTDGACSNNGQAGCRGGIGVWFGHDHPLNVSEPLCPPPGQNRSATNNWAEIAAATAAVKAARSASIQRLEINTDSQFLIRCMTDWLPHWKRNGFMTSTGQPVKNKAEIVDLSNEINKSQGTKCVQIKWTHVRGHQGDKGNEAADALAVAGSHRAVRSGYI